MSLFRRLFDVARSQVSPERGGQQELGADTNYRSEQTSTQSAKASASSSKSSPSNAADSVDAKYYANLELEPGADYAQIKAAHRKLQRQYHPDRHHKEPEQTALALEISKRLNEAMDHFEKKFARERA